MARKPRIIYPGATYHAYARGNERRDIFIDSDDRTTFLRLLQDAAETFNWKVYGYCLMNNHYHLLLRTVRGSLSDGMHWLNCVFAQRFNRRHGRIGHLFQGRFGDTLVQDGAHLNVAIRYISLNPVRAGFVDRPENWPWGSHAALIGKVAPHPCLHEGGILLNFGRDLATARRAYAAYVAAAGGENQPDWRQPILGDEDFKKSCQELLKEAQNEGEYSQRNRLVSRPKLEEIILSGTKWDRDSMQRRDSGIYRATVKFGYKQGEIADFLGLHYTRISRIMSKIKRLKGKM